MVVDLPAPFGPRKPNVSPVATSKLMPRTASMSPYRLVSSLTAIAVLRPGPEWAGPGCAEPPASAPVCTATCCASLYEPLIRA